MLRLSRIILICTVVSLCIAIQVSAQEAPAAGGRAGGMGIGSAGRGGAAGRGMMMGGGRGGGPRSPEILVDVSVPRQGALLFIAVMDGHLNVTNGCAALFTLWKEAGRPVEIHVYDHAYGPASGMPVATWTDRFYDWLVARKIVTE
jgi:hypothetical protein